MSLKVEEGVGRRRCLLTSMDDGTARTEGVDGGTVYRYQQEIAQMVRTSR